MNEPYVPKPPIRVFDKNNPCDKIDLHNFFYQRGFYHNRNAVDAPSEIGPSAPKYLRMKGYMTQFILYGIDRYALTTEGKEWLSKGVAKHLERHPEDAARLKEPIQSGTLMQRLLGPSDTSSYTSPAVVVRKRPPSK